MTPTFITFTGVDARTDFAACAILAREYPVEFGFLYSTTRDDYRYSGVSQLPHYADAGIRTAVHLCGRAAREAMKSHAYPIVCAPANRVQVNLVARDYTWAGLEALGGIKPTIQQTRDTSKWPLTPLDVAPLLDCSGGRGTEIAAYPEHTPAQLVGYAGGFRPGNVRPFLDGLHEHPHGFWVDMETGVRTDDWFDVAKCRAVCEEVYG